MGSILQHNIMIPTVSLDAYAAARRRAAFVARSSRGRLLLSGADRAAYLQGLLTNDIAALKPGQGCYAAYLTPQGRMIADLHVYELGDGMLLTLPGGTKDTVLARLDELIFSEDVQVRDATDVFAEIAVIGPEAAAALSQVLTGTSEKMLAMLPAHGNLKAEAGGEPAIVARIDDAGEEGYGVFINRAADSFVPALAARGVVPLDASTAEAIRIEAGVPLFHHDMDEDTIPLEAGIEARAISFTKGCYVGQEVVIRVLHRGHGRVARKLVGLILDPSTPGSGGAVVRSGEREVGRVTSSAFSPVLQKPIALAYVHRDFVTPGTAVSVEGAPAEVTALPFVHPPVKTSAGPS
jgi:folate-binding protein YgfZ